MEKEVSIMIVDDHQIVIDGIKSMLSDQQHYIITASAKRGEDAWEIVSGGKQRYDIIITDISMPSMSGTELCRKIKSFDSTIKVLILSMHNEVEYIKEALICEADGYILKNSGRNELLSALEMLIEKGSYFGTEIVPLLFKEVENERYKKNPGVMLSARETEVLMLILQEYTSKEIAEKLFISKQTVDSHRIKIMEKTSSKSIVGLIKYAIQHKMPLPF